jgi:hypothetical protein
MERDLEKDLWRSDEILHKVRTRNDYAQNVYAALCNMRWQPEEVWPVLKDEYWSCSWRSAGGLVARLLKQGDYMDFYCSGIRGGMSYDDDVQLGFVAEGEVTDEIREDFAKLGWHPSPWPEDKK